MSNFLIGPCLIVILPADASTLVTCASINADWATAACAQANSASAEIRGASLFMSLSFLQWFDMDFGLPGLTTVTSTAGLAAGDFSERRAGSSSGPLYSYATVPSGCR